MKTTSLIVLFSMLLCLSTTASAQDAGEEPKGKPTVYIDYFSRSTAVPFAMAEGLRNSVISGIQKMNRIILIDVDSQAALRVEENRRSSDNVTAGEDNDMERLSVMNQLGAQYIISGQITSMSSTWKSPKDGKEGYYAGAVAYTLKVINPKNGTTVGTKTFSHSGNGESKEVSITKALNSASGSMRDFVDEYFKMEGIIIEIDAQKKGKAESVFINLGTQHGVIEDQKFEVFLVREVAGRTSRKEIGRLNVKAVEGEDISLCKVSKGGEEILAAFNDGAKIVVVSRGQTLWGSLIN